MFTTTFPRQVWKKAGNKQVLRRVQCASATSGFEEERTGIETLPIFPLGLVAPPGGDFVAL
jgi:hypothetical protein